ncbi:hypothetical protein SPBR_01927 [Sporothrix brasiliensis 5110]|uniref:ER membrane protein complex subunit 7 beta-sandwich domain-containing protein n=1 Tax=Sporothrix brasiliensis 5110 TaxID=1398154 RepID=A0A0C2EXY3_9PEZI|nr:uncharacterized protein SPBR_01927 [Sporothrix brasiliensis 5110]KIH91544.1 hypothetical protein SPBR_01927 [Sporothrix brasiliensis 5110]
MRPFSTLSLVQLLVAATTAVASASSAVSPPPSTSITFQIGVPSRVQEQEKESAAVALLSSIPGWTRATLESGDGRQYVSAPITAGGKLVFSNVTAGSYLGEVHCATHIFSPLRVDVEEEADPAATGAAKADSRLLVTRITETYRGNDWANQGEVVQRVLPVKVGGAGAHDGVALTNTGPTFLVAPTVLQTKSYYSERSSFDVLSLLKNPMILMAIVALVMMVGMPYMMDQMDPEMRAEFEERQKSNPMNSLLGGGGGGGRQAPPGANFDMAAFLAGSGKSDKKPGGGGAPRK